MSERFSVEGYGVDDLSLGFDMSGLRSVRTVLDGLEGVETMRGKMLGSRTSWGEWMHYLGPSVAIWKEDTQRLYVQAKLASKGELCPPEDVLGAVDALTERMARLGIESWAPPWVTRVDVAVDATCDPADGKLLLDALEAARLPNGWRTSWRGTPRSTVYFLAARSEKVLARAYCRNLKLRRGEPFGLIRLEASQRYQPRAKLLVEVASPPFLGHLWDSRFGALAETVTRLPVEGQALDLGRLMASGELRPSQAERLNFFLALERLGLAVKCYPQTIYAARRREAAKLGYGGNDGRPALEVELLELLRPYRDAIGLAA